MPYVRNMAATGFYKQVNSVMPSVTNVNNVSIVTGAFPKTHGITSNYYLDRDTGEGKYIEDNTFLLAPTIFEISKKKRAANKTALFVTKQKLLRILQAGTDIAGRRRSTLR